MEYYARTLSITAFNNIIINILECLVLILNFVGTIVLTHVDYFYLNIISEF